MSCVPRDESFLSTQGLCQALLRHPQGPASLAELGECRNLLKSSPLSFVPCPCCVPAQGHSAASHSSASLQSLPPLFPDKPSFWQEVRICPRAVTSPRDVRTATTVLALTEPEAPLPSLPFPPFPFSFPLPHTSHTSPIPRFPAGAPGAAGICPPRVWGPGRQQSDICGGTSCLYSQSGIQARLSWGVWNKLLMCH